MFYMWYSLRSISISVVDQFDAVFFSVYRNCPTLLNNWAILHNKDVLQ